MWLSDRSTLALLESGSPPTCRDGSSGLALFRGHVESRYSKRVARHISMETPGPDT